jgi:anthranilate phosphoribosyltransferase
MALLPFLHRVADRSDLSSQEAEQAMSIILSGGATVTQIGAFLVAMRMKGETAEEILGFARAMRERALRVDAGLNGATLLDTCGTGGDGQSTFNISTIAAFVVAGAGVRVAKHGNRSISSRCGSADLLEALGVRILSEPAQMARAIRETGIGFLYAPSLHPAMKYAQPARVDLKMRTLFNLLGPLANPAWANVQLIGAFSEAAAELMAGALAQLGIQRAFVVHGSDGLDEITTTGPTLVFEVRPGQAVRRTLHPRDFEVAVARAEDLRGGSVEENVAIARAVLSGAAGPARDIVVANAAAALFLAEAAPGLVQAARCAADSIDSGAALRKLHSLVEFTRAVTPE